MRGMKPIIMVSLVGMALLRAGQSQAPGSVDFVQEYRALRASLEAFWQRAPLLLNNVRLVQGTGNSYGIYEPRPQAAFQAGEPIYLYLEPVGYTLKKNPTGFYEFGFTADFTVKDAAGKVLGGQTAFADLNFRSWNFNTEVALTFTYRFSALKKGSYKVATVVKDKFSGKQATVEKEFTIL